MIDLLSHDPITVHVGKLAVSVPYAPAARWSGAVTGAQGLGGTLMRLADASVANEIARSLVHGSTTSDELFTASHELLRAATGLPWWAAARLLGLGNDPRTTGHMVLAAVDPWSLTVGQWCAAVFTLYTRDRKPEEVFKFEVLVHAAPPGEVDEWGDNDYETMVQAARSLPGMK